MKFTVRAFKELTAKELFDIYYLRAAVFVVEQNCAFQDPDDKDLKALHVLGYEEDRMIAYSRLLPQNITYPEPSIGRVVVHKGVRGKGVGRQLMQFSIIESKKRFKTTVIVIGAQCYLEEFYKTLGFVSEGSSYFEDNILHIQMRLTT